MDFLASSVFNYEEKLRSDTLYGRANGVKALEPVEVRLPPGIMRALDYYKQKINKSFLAEGQLLLCLKLKKQFHHKVIATYSISLIEFFIYFAI